MAADLSQGLRRIRCVISIGLAWAAAWGGAAAILVLGIVLVTGSRPDPPFPLMAGAFGLVAGVAFAGLLGLVQGPDPTAQMSLPRSAACGAAAGFLLATMFILAVAMSGDPSFLWNLATVGPAFAAAGAASGAGSLGLASRTERWRRPLCQLGTDGPRDA